jgi:UDP-N-acetylglucosamine 1-carboxyvinyltransferase
LEDRPITLSPSLSNTHSSSEEDKTVLEIWGGASLHGHVDISGAKNSALVIMAGALLCSQDCLIRNVPALADVTRMAEILSALGVKLERQGNSLLVNASHIAQSKAPYELVSQLRASFFVIGPLLARLGVAKIPCLVAARSALDLLTSCARFAGNGCRCTN